MFTIKKLLICDIRTQARFSERTLILLGKAATNSKQD